MKPLTLDGTLDALGEIRRYVGAAAQSADLTKRQTYQLQLAVDEIATNAIVHGYEEAGLAGNVEISADLSPATLTITLTDQGTRYNANQRDQPDMLDKPIAEREIGGLGVFLAQQGVDDFRYEWKEGRNHNIFVVNRPEETNQ